MAPKAAQVMKYATNAFLASRLSMAHELARFCDEVGVDASEVLNSLGDDPRIGHNYLELAPGWGGQCFPKDTAALVALGDERGFDFHMTRAAIRSNEEQITFAATQIRNLVGAETPRVALLGLTFKPKTSDRRASSALRIAASLLAEGVTISAYDPTVSEPAPDLRGLLLHDTAADAVGEASVIAVMVKWEEFANLDWHDVAQRAPKATIFDPHNFLDREAIARAGLGYRGMGRQ